MKRIGFIGAGRMAYALMKSMEKNAGTILMSDKSKDRLDFIKKNSSAEITEKNKVVVRDSDVVFLCVKPQQVKDILKEIKSSIKNKIIISIAAGVKISTIQAIIGKKKIVRVMPNTPCLFGEMAAGFSTNEYVDKYDLKVVDELLNEAGTAIFMEEDKLDAVTALSGSGPAYFARIVKFLTQAAVSEGLEESVALKLAAQTALGSGKMLLEMTPDELVEMVASPNGTTVEGLKVIDSSNLKNIMKKTIKAATDKSRELGKK